jgi:hypothetical protein
MKKLVYLFTSIVLILIVIIWRLYLDNFLASFYHFNEWGIYIFPTPTAYCIGSFFSTKKQPPLKIITFIFIGALISILLSENFLLLKILMSLVGAIVTWIVTKRQ